MSITIPETIRFIKHTLNINSAKLADLMGIDSSLVCCWAKGKFIPAGREMLTLHLWEENIKKAQEQNEKRDL